MDRARIVATGTVEQVVASAGVAGRGRIRVAPSDVRVAAASLTDCPAVVSTAFDNTRPGDIDLDFAIDAAHPSRNVLSALLDARIEPRAFDLRRARLSDAFLALTTNGNRR